MARWAPERADVLAEIAGEVLGLFPRGRIVVGIDGFDDTVTGPFAADLAAAFAPLPAASTALAGLRPEAEPPIGDDVVREFRRDVLAPFRASGALPGPPAPSRADGPWDRAVLVVWGRFLLTPDLVGIWHSSAWVDVQLQDAIRRLPEPISIPAAEFELEGRRYLRRVDPKRRASMNIDASNPGHPRRTFADSC